VAYLVERSARYEMQDTKDKILVWLPSPLGDAILCTPALRAIRKRFSSCEIAFAAELPVRELLSPCKFNDNWLQHRGNNPFVIARELKKHKFTRAILFKNSFGSALAVRLAGIPARIGYAREGRGFLLTDRLYPPKLPDGRFKPASMIDYYRGIADYLGGDTRDRSLELSIEPKSGNKIDSRFPELAGTRGPMVIFVPGGAFGPSKCWPSERFAETADRLIANYNATIIISVAPQPLEQQIAKEICAHSKHKLINLAERPLGPGELKALFSRADLVIANDTGPRHIAIALRRKVITLFGPNDPAWTDTDYENEIQIIGNVPCAPCTKPVCKKARHLCMEAITVEMVCDAAKSAILRGGLEHSKTQAVVKVCREFAETSKSFFIDPDYKTAFDRLGLASIDAVFSFSAARNLSKDNLAAYRSRLQFETSPPPTTVFLKRYDRPPIAVQLKNWFSHRGRKACSLCELESASELAAQGINTPKIICYGEEWGTLFEKRSFIISEKIPDAESLERKLPIYFEGPCTVKNLKLRRDFIAKSAAFVRRFHQTAYRHRDLYFSHIYHGDNGEFYLIDLARAFKPVLLRQRFRTKDIAQLHYSAPARRFSRTDRMRFYLDYAGKGKLTANDKAFIRKVMRKAEVMSLHDEKHGRTAPFAG